MKNMLIGLITGLAAVTTAQAQFRPDIPDFYSTLETVKTAVEPLCSSSDIRELDILLDVTRSSQQQIDCEGFMYRGKERFMELMFSDGELDLVIILLDREDYEALLVEFRATYGETTHESDIGQFWYYSAVALRTRPYEVVFASKRTRANYQLYMDYMAQQAAAEGKAN